MTRPRPARLSSSCSGLIQPQAAHTACLLNIGGRGTLYPDVIESLSFKGPSATIKVSQPIGLSNASKC